MKIRLVLAFFLVFILATTALGCDQVKGSGVFYDEYTGEPVEFKVNIVAGKSNDIYDWTEVRGSIHLDDESKGVKVRGGPWMRFYEPNYFMVWDVHVNGEKCEFLDFSYYEETSEEPAWFWIMIYDNNAIAYKWWGWESEVEGDIIIKD